VANALRLYRAIVVSTNDPQGLGRIQLSIDRTVRKAAGQIEGWVNVATCSCGMSAATKPLYEVGDRVLYAAERLPFVGAVVVCRETNSVANAGAHAFTIPLGPGNEATIETTNGALRLSTTAGQQVTLNPNGTIDVLANNISFRSSTMSVSAAMVTIDSGMMKFSGTVQCDTLIANAVVSASYTPGAGNIW
jgi:hypothetical protein